MEKYNVIEIQGGCGKSIMMTSLVSKLHKLDPERKNIVVTGYPEIFLNNPKVYRSYTIGQTPYFYYDFIKEKDVMVYANDPYRDNNYITNPNWHFIDTANSFTGTTEEKQDPEIFLTASEIQNVKNIVIPKSEGKPIFYLQTNGGGQGQANQYSWARDIPIELSSIIVKAMNQAGYKTFHVKRPDQPKIDGTESIDGGFRNLIALLTLSSKRLLIDSFSQHAAAALKLKSTVIWIGTSPKKLGYEMHHNIIAKYDQPNQFPHAYLSDFDITGNPLESPPEIKFDAKEIVDSLNSQ